MKNFSKIFPSDPELLPEIETYAVEIAQEVNLNEDKFNDLSLAVAEAASNGIKHGNKNDPNKKLYVNITVSESEFVVSIKDEGTGFKPEDVPDPTKPENILKDSGRGLHIMKSFSENVKFNFTDTGTEVILTIKF